MSHLLTEMPAHPTWQDMVIRLVVTLCAGVAIGLNRESQGKAAGLRTTILVGLAAAIAMIQANILLATAGKQADSFATMDVLRFPLGVLTGVGFIGAGAILRRADLVTGVTTAATLWAMTAIGLAFGGGQLWLGAAGTLLALATLQVLRRVEDRLQHSRHAVVALACRAPAALPDLGAALSPLGFDVQFLGFEQLDDSGARCYRFRINWKNTGRAIPGAQLVAMLGQHGTIRRFEMADHSG
jgi:putative Mg2+ transporter-C (MgtC) family protein